LGIWDLGFFIMTGDDFRELALAQPGAEERAHMGHPDFRANGRIFATLQADERTGMVKVTPEEQAVLLRDYTKVFTPAAGAWGRQGCTMVHLAAATLRVVRPAMQLAYELAVSTPPSKKSGARRRT
jgi:predicted DNA-binding protein (MmcQ/YjbR family)